MSRARLLGPAALLAIPLVGSAGRASTPPPIVFSANLAPAVSGEIYRLDPNGRREDLSKSTWQDTQPVVSTDGKRVAFLSNRNGGHGVYEVGINGGNLARVAGSLRGGYPLSLAWQPHGSVLAAESSGAAIPEGRCCSFGRTEGRWSSPAAWGSAPRTPPAPNSPGRRTGACSSSGRPPPVLLRRDPHRGHRRHGAPHARESSGLHVRRLAHLVAGRKHADVREEHV